jgi:GcrA cell cycle regulator
MWKEGFSASVIGQTIGRTRNSIIGKVMRLGLRRNQMARIPRPQNGVVVKRRGAARPDHPWAKLSTGLQTVPKIDRSKPIFSSPQERRKTLDELQDHHCRWPYTDDGPTTYCGSRRVEPTSYCAAHCAVAFVPYVRKV